VFIVMSDISVLLMSNWLGCLLVRAGLARWSDVLRGASESVRS
jgi:hypothetical protein